MTHFFRQNFIICEQLLYNSFYSQLFTISRFDSNFKLEQNEVLIYSYFVSSYSTGNEYKKELNCKNPLGTGGKLAEAYAHLIHTMWSGQNSSFSPREFKVRVDK